MSSDDELARVRALAAKADELCVKGHVVRSAENYGRAAEAASALGADNLVAVSMQLSQANMLNTYAARAAHDGAAAPSVLAAHRASNIALLSAAVAALERRRVAGTLLEGSCTAAEEAWHATVVLPPRGGSLACAGWALLFGYEVYLNAAKHVTDVLSVPPAFKVECPAVQLQSLTQQVVRATEMMQQPRRYGSTMAMKIEVHFTLALRETLTDAAVYGLDARLLQLLAGAWQRLERSGVLEARGILQVMRQIQPHLQNIGLTYPAVVSAAFAAPGLRCCALPDCGAKEAHPAHFKSCAACRGAVYCGREHQVEHWPAHKAACKAARKTGRSGA
jgi:hypothetical protein